MKSRATQRLAALLIILQMVAGPFAMAFASGAGAADCAHAGTIHPWHAEAGCDDAVPPGDPARPTHHHAQIGHQCHCAHTVLVVPIVSSPVFVAALATDAEAVAGRLHGPAYPAPLFELLRPPN